MGRLDGKVAIVTGAAQGTGAATAARFASEGATVVLGDVQVDAGQSVADRIGTGAHFVELDVRDEHSWANAVATAVQLGGVDVLVNNAAVLLLAPLDEITRSDAIRLFEVNQLGPLLGIQAVLEPMKAAGGGSIVNISSTDGIRGMNGVTAYAATKWGVRGITKSTAVELGHHGIRVNAVCPEAGNPNMAREFIPGRPDLSGVGHQMMQHILAAPAGSEPASRIDHVVNMILFLASDDSLSCTGADFVVDAGLTMGHLQEGAPRA